ncbi:MauE/DoxX family redox-associated membrane protein [Flavobacterium sp. IB48]|uniref:MauE/DoxX family redox-associated membrane protein n=1 Tax=Flavobacterium sp. IB48 TaxID=2779375 RepID=UPI0018E7CE36|nr:MauE/DoxX family redox-associated membrane protein [Flavobacterium sp. IB48]MBJ2126360.1 hypothetical protein [Flavobacterium sp. IB48]
MKTSVSFKNIVVDIICLLFVLLFVYAATSKLFDFENFKIQLGQSPLLSAVANWTSITVPVLEIIIAASLLLRHVRLVGLYASYLLMIMFTAYIYIILNYSAFVPCSCGGILEKMTWGEHLVFNICFIILAIIGILFIPVKGNVNNQ